MKRGLFISFLLLFPGIILAQTFTASVNRNPVGLNEQFQLSFTLNASGSSFKAPPLNDFMVLSGPNQSTSMQFMNGSMSQSITFSYILQPKKEGTFKLEPATVESGGKVVLSNMITITVNKGSGQSNRGGGQQGDEKTNISTNNIFIRVSVDKTNVYRGEAIVATYKLYTNVQVINYSINKVPAFNGFWSQDMQMPAQLELHNEVVNGINYQVGEIKKVVLFPQQSGQLILDPMEGECIARIQVKRNRTGSPFDIFNDPFFNDPFFSSGGIRDVKFAVKSDPIRINVKELPPNAPESFTGAVGRFSIESSIDQPKVKNNDPVSFRIKLSGKGNIKLAEAPALDLSPDIEKYDPRITDNITVNERGASGSRSFEYLLIPRHAGNYQLGPVEFTYFDLDKRSYVTLKTRQVNLQVEKSKDGGSAMSMNGRADFQLLGRDIRFIHATLPEFNSGGDDDFYGSPFFWILVATPFIGLILLIFYRNKIRKDNSDIAGVRSRKATSMAKKRLEKANAILKSGNAKGFYDEAGQAIWKYLSDKLRLPVASLTTDSVITALQQHGASTDTAGQLISALQYCEYARFGNPGGDISPEKIYQDIISIITRLENEIRK